jgi:hypothetical protein
MVDIASKESDLNHMDAAAAAAWVSLVVCAVKQDGKPFLAVTGHCVRHRIGRPWSVLGGPL